jgi:hypothetical protein
MQRVLDKYKFTYTIAGHAGNGNFHIIPLMRLSKKSEVEIIKKCNLEIFPWSRNILAVFLQNIMMG